MQFMTAEKAYLSQGYCDPKRKWQGGGGGYHAFFIHLGAKCHTCFVLNNL